jgi:hypothetical protein
MAYQVPNYIRSSNLPSSHYARVAPITMVPSPLLPVSAGVAAKGPGLGTPGSAAGRRMTAGAPGARWVLRWDALLHSHELVTLNL